MNEVGRSTGSRSALPADWYHFEQYAERLSGVLIENGLSREAASKEAVLDLLVAVRRGHIEIAQRELLRALGDLWSNTARRSVARELMDLLREPRDDRPGSSGGRARQMLASVSHLFQTMTNPAVLEHSKESVESGLRSLGYSDTFIRKVTKDHPRLASDILAYAKTNPEKAKPAVLYRGLSLAKPEDFDPRQIGGHGIFEGEAFFARDAKTAIGFAGGKAAQRGESLLLMEVEVPSFMIEMSPPQMGEAVWPLLRKGAFPDPENADLVPFIRKVGVREPGASDLAWREYDGVSGPGTSA